MMACESFDGFSALRHGLRKIASLKDHWAGIPMPLDGEELVIERKFPHATALMAMGGATDNVRRELESLKQSNDEYGTYTVRNRFHSGKKGRYVVIYDTEKQGIVWGCDGGVHHFSQMLRTMGCSVAWGVEQERRALDYLATLIRHHQFKQYLMTGMFMETSPRSNVHYLFRKLRPTVAVTFNSRGHRLDKRNDGTPRILAALCMHPIGFYSDSWAGAMCPTDDVIAHLMLMRGDEHMFWKRCTQHPPWDPLSGI